ncbi:transcriptional regulator family: Fungal Specific TF [Penicillium capsulatum]|uniref:Transcriptional regulator family: Fungal Specific TF n=1 Tax=Penicillium capsulatum TaxID=69766 RepID=A0A9W9LL21_9EURO|nr:transcriptional regulator family: Fungal Specific TF [Penicillium capsulatum]KAJ6117483.1 transcriptional regulator family: Fungal Specific TF [Penicillium capsulatum]
MLPACKRCRQQKKRCTRTADGSCKPCNLAWLPCSFLERSTSPKSRDRESQARINWLSELVNQTLPNGVTKIENIETGRDVALRLSPYTPIQTEGASQDESPESQPIPEDVDVDQISIATSRKCLHAYFRHVHRAYPFVDSEAALKDFESICEDAKGDLLWRTAVSCRLSMIIAIGFTTLQRVGEIQNDDGRVFEPCLKTVLQESLCHPNEESAGTLLLLGLYLLFKPSNMDPRAISGILTRQSMTLGLLNDPPHSPSHSPRSLELRRRLSWSIYVFDRMISISYGIPLGFPDKAMQVPLPSIMIHEYASPEGHQYTIALQVSRHVIALRQLEACIVQVIYNQNLSARHRELRRRIDDWYTQGCLLSSSALWEEDQLPFHNTITWLNVRYQNLLLLLYSPSAQGEDLDDDQILELQSAAQQYVKLSLILHEHRHLPINWITLCRLLSLAGVFLYCVMRWSPSHHDIPEVSLLVSLFEIYPPHWKAAHEGSRILRRLVDLMTKQKHPVIPLDQSSSASISNCGLDAELEFQAVKDGLASLLRETLGEASFYTWHLRSNVPGRKISDQVFPIDVLNTVPTAATQSAQFDLSQPGILTPADNPIGSSPMETQWMNFLGGLGSDML